MTMESPWVKLLVFLLEESGWGLYAVVDMLVLS